jgi:hypothetical protein
MPKRKQKQQEILDLIEKRPIILFGHPGRLRGDLFVRNPGSEPVELRFLPVTAAGHQPAPLRAAKPTQDLAMRLKPGLIRPGHAGRVSLSLDLDPSTPPGEYQAEVEMAGKKQVVTLHVTERIDLRVLPNQLVIENHPGQKNVKRVLVNNRGNIPLNIGEIGAVFLDDDLLYCRTLRAAAAAVGDELQTLDHYLAQILLSAKNVAERSGILRIHNLAGEVTVQPGETEALDLEVRVPPGLDRRGRYRGVVAIYTADLSFVIVPTSGPPIPEDEKEVPKHPVRKTGTSEKNN